ncbi:MAG: DUF6537 domain-containing protein [Rhodoferax sp.]
MDRYPPPLLTKRDPVTGEPQKRAFGRWIIAAFRLLARMPFLRGYGAESVWPHARARIDLGGQSNPGSLVKIRSVATRHGVRLRPCSAVPASVRSPRARRDRRFESWAGNASY